MDAETTVAEMRAIAPRREWNFIAQNESLDWWYQRRESALKVTSDGCEYLSSFLCLIYSLIFITLGTIMVMLPVYKCCGVRRTWGSGTNPGYCQITY